MDTWEQLAECERRLDDHAAYVKACMRVASDRLADPSKRQLYVEKLLQFLSDYTGTILYTCQPAARTCESIAPDGLLPVRNLQTLSPWW